MMNASKLKKSFNKFCSTAQILVFLIIASGCTSDHESLNSFRVGFYNVENLFDIQDDPQTQDNDFLPTGANRWTLERYKDKIDKLSSVIVKLSPQIMGLAEIENSIVLRDIIESTKNSDHEFGFVHYDSPDYRGIDVGLLYQKNNFEIIKKNSYSIPKLNTRSILYVKGRIIGWAREIHLFITHFPSRIGGKVKSEKNRLLVANQLRNYMDEILQENPGAEIIVMGDFNDEPGDKSIYEVLNAKDDVINQNDFLNPAYSMAEEGLGSYLYRGQWDMLDQILLSSKLADREALDYVAGSFSIYSPEWLLQSEGKYKGYPSRTYAGSKYLGGYSDHLPVYLDLRMFATKEASL